MKRCEMTSVLGLSKCLQDPEHLIWLVVHEYVGSASYFDVFDGWLGYGVTCTLPLG
jgi:hypothetical protein